MTDRVSPRRWCITRVATTRGFLRGLYRAKDPQDLPAIAPGFLAWVSTKQGK